MNLDFPSRFLKKLEIYQQIRGDQGLSKYKRLWKYEAAFLQTAYGKGHQHLSNFVSRSNFKKWIEETTPFHPRKDEDELNQIIANLFWRGYIDVADRVNDKKVDKDKIDKNAPKGLLLLDKNVRAFKSATFGDESNLDYRPTLKGLLIGEVLTEINNKNIFLKYWNKYKYNWVLDTVWFLVFFGLLKLILPAEIQQSVEKSRISFFSVTIGYVGIMFMVIVIFWPFLSLLYRKAYSMMED